MAAWESAGGSGLSCARSSDGALLLLRADAGPAIGVGHLMRCLALAETWLHAGGRALLVSTGLSPAAAARLVEAGIAHRQIDAQPGSLADAEGTRRCAAEAEATWVVLDGYRFDGAYQRDLKRAGFRLLAIDDFGHMGEYAADLVLDQNLGARPEAYARRAPESRLLLGARFVLLRRQFATRAGDRRDARPAPCRVLVTLGGGDAQRTTAAVVRAIERIPAELISGATVVLGDSCPHALVIDGEAAARIQVRRSVGDMAALMVDCDLAIAGGGTTAWELAFMGVPTVHLALAENQVPNCEALDAAGAGQYVRAPEGLAEALSRWAEDSAGRNAMAARARVLVDGQGAWRVWQYLNEDRLHLREAAPGDARLLWEWANAPEIRAVSFSPEPIPWERHVAWLSGRLGNPACRTWIGEESGRGPVGQVRFDLASEEAVISMSLDAAARGRQLGSLLIWTACRQLFAARPETTVVALIKPENVASIRAFTRAGFRPAGVRTVAGGPAPAFTLRREQVVP